MKKINKPVLHLIKVNKLYEMGEVKISALVNIDLSITAGEYVAIVGPSGSGKSTLMHILGLLDNPTSGQVLLNGKNVSQLSEKVLAGLRNRYIGFVFQQFNLLPKTMAWQNAALPLIYSRVSRKKRYGLAVEALTQVGLENRPKNRPNQLSGGQQQRVAIARALINNPSVIFADEPTGNLDTASGKIIMDLFDRLNKEGKTIVLVTHEENVAKHARRVIRIVDGKIAQHK